eukprot:COSAG01_NODE_10253_length_2209_cov_2.851659_2_plen_81_part_00
MHNAHLHTSHIGTTPTRVANSAVCVGSDIVQSDCIDCTSTPISLQKSKKGRTVWIAAAVAGAANILCGVALPVRSRQRRP